MLFSPHGLKLTPNLLQSAARLQAAAGVPRLTISNPARELHYDADRSAALVDPKAILMIRAKVAQRARSRAGYREVTDEIDLNPLS